MLDSGLFFNWNAASFIFTYFFQHGLILVYNLYFSCSEIYPAVKCGLQAPVCARGPGINEINQSINNKYTSPGRVEWLVCSDFLDFQYLSYVDQQRAMGPGGGRVRRTKPLHNCPIRCGKLHFSPWLLTSPCFDCIACQQCLSVGPGGPAREVKLYPSVV